MGPYYEIVEDPSVTPGAAATRSAAAEWQHWDEKIVEELLRWLSRLAKVFAISIFAVFAAVYMGCL